MHFLIFTNIVSLQIQFRYSYLQKKKNQKNQTSNNSLPILPWLLSSSFMTLGTWVMWALTQIMAAHACFYIGLQTTGILFPPRLPKPSLFIYNSRGKSFINLWFRGHDLGKWYSPNNKYISHFRGTLGLFNALSRTNPFQYLITWGITFKWNKVFIR